MTILLLNTLTGRQRLKLFVQNMVSSCKGHLRIFIMGVQNAKKRHWKEKCVFMLRIMRLNMFINTNRIGLEDRY